MAFYVKKSLIFLLTTLLLIWSSHADDHILHVRQGRDRKLISVAPFVRPLKGIVTSAAGGKGLMELSSILAKRIGQAPAQKAFAKGFRVGWKSGKWYYQVKEWCQSPNVNCNAYFPVCFSCGNTASQTFYTESCVPGGFRCTYVDGVIYVWGPANTSLSTEDASKLCSLPE